MKKTLLLTGLSLLLLSSCETVTSRTGNTKPFDFEVPKQPSVGLNETYYSLVYMADSLYTAKAYKSSALVYSDAFNATGGKGLPDDRYIAACSWALAAIPDSAFFQLNSIAKKENYTKYEHITTDSNLNSLHADRRWAALLELIKQNKEKTEANFDKPLVAQLDSIFTEDQKYRLEIDEIQKKFGPQSKEMDAQWKIIEKKDATNLIKVKAILDKHGWLGPDVVGEQGSSTLFLVIQHADQETQEKYLPMMREAVKNGKALSRRLALLVDRVAIGQGKKQIYGSQISMDMKTQLYYVKPLEDPDNVDKRRLEVGLEPLALYVKTWQIKWDVEQYKKDLPGIEQMEKGSLW
jgi:hypothetical protein